MGFHLPTQTRERLERSTRLEDDRRRDPSGVVVSMPTGIDRARRIERVRRWIIVQLSSEGKPAVARGEAEAQSGE